MAHLPACHFLKLLVAGLSLLIKSVPHVKVHAVESETSVMYMILEFKKQFRKWLTKLVNTGKTMDVWIFTPEVPATSTVLLMWMLRIANVRPKLSLVVLTLEPIQDPWGLVAEALEKPGQINVVWACLQQEEKIRFSTKHSSKGYFNSKINVFKLVIPSAGAGCMTSCRNLLVLVSIMSSPGSRGHCSQVPVGLWNKNGREHTAGYQNNLMTCLLWWAPWGKKKSI